MKSDSTSSSEFIALNGKHALDTQTKLKAFQESALKSPFAPEISPHFVVTPFTTTESSHTCIGEMPKRSEESVTFGKVKRRCKKLEEYDYSTGCNIGRWEKDEQRRFVEALEKFDRDWKKIVSHVGTRSIVQVRSHAQKYFSKLERQASKLSKANSQIVPESKSRPDNIPIMLEVGKVKLKRYSPGITQIKLKPAMNKDSARQELFSDMDEQALKKPKSELDSTDQDNGNPDAYWEQALESVPSGLDGANFLGESMEGKEYDVEFRLSFDGSNFA